MQRMVESCKHHALTPLSSSDPKTFETSDQLNQIADASTFVAVPRLSRHLPRKDLKGQLQLVVLVKPKQCDFSLLIRH